MASIDFIGDHLHAGNISLRCILFGIFNNLIKLYDFNKA